MKKLPDALSAAQRRHIRQQLDDACDFDPRDPLLGLAKSDLEGPRLKRRTVLRLLAASGTLSLWHLLPDVGMREARAASGGHLRAGWAGVGELRTFDPARINQVLLFQISSNVLSGLMHIDADLVARGDLAESWTVSDDGTEYVFKLRENVKFHNGDALTAKDVVFTYNRSKDPEQSIHSGVLKNVKDVIALNDYEVKFVLAGPQASFLTKTLERSSGRAMTIVSPGALEALGPAQYGLTPVGTGPFRVTDHQLGQAVVLEKFADYYDPERPKLDKVTITPIIDPEPLAAAIEAGDIQLIGGNPIAPEIVDRFLENPDLEVSIVPGPTFQSVFMNPWREPFVVTDFNKPLDELMQEKGFKVRLAIAKALDRDRFIKQGLFGRGVPAYGSVNPAMAFFFDDSLGESSEQRYDLDEARRLLAEAGYPQGEGFPELSIICRPDERRQVQVITNILKRNLGIDVKLVTQDFPVLLENFQAMNYELLRVGSGGDFDPDDALVDWMTIDSKFNGRNRDRSKMPYGHFHDPEVDRLTAEQAVTADPERRKALVQQANRITSDKVASCFLYHPIDALVHHKRVNFPAVSRIPGLVDLDRVTLS